MKKLLSSLLLLSLLPVYGCSDSAAAGTSGTQKLETKNVPVYCAGLQDYRSPEEMILTPEFPLYYTGDAGDLPYTDLAEFVGLMNSVDAADSGKTAENYTYSTDSDIFTCTYGPRSSDVIFDFHNGTMTYSCMDTFGKDPAYSPFELQTNELEYLQRTYDPRVGHLGSPKTLSLSDYGIPMLREDEKYLVPLHTAYDFLMWVPQCPWSILTCNDSAIFIGGHNSMFGYSDALSELGEIYFGQQPAERSPKLAQYGYDELCLILDAFYGLKDTHRIDSFRGFLRNNGYEEKLLSTDAKEADQALLDIIRFVLDDFHSSDGFPSWMSGADAEMSYEGKSLCQSTDEIREKNFEDAFADSSLDGNDFYTESGNTAYIILSDMTAAAESDHFYQADSNDINTINSSDVAERILYADNQINRENSPVENVVLDLSRNHGGDVNSAGCVLSWFLGEGYVVIGNSFSGGLGITRYKADISRDHQFTEADTLQGKKKLFCLISPETFSSANLTAAMLKMSGVVTMIGQTSRGGSGIKTPAVTGWDSIFYMSGFRTVATEKNGSWYDMDTGVVPDVYIAEPETFYDREKLTDIINGIH